jgi:pimeloyl-ACP methyl ester carboxylesterase
LLDLFEEAQFEGRVLRYVCGGDGMPAVVIDQGQGLSIERGFERPVAFGWAKVFGELRKSTRVVMHDRAGLGESSVPESPRACAEMVKDLRVVLSAAGLEPPYILVGHSIGGLNAQYFAAHFPGEVAGLILVDSSHPDQASRMTKVMRREVDPASSPEMIDFIRSAEQARSLTTLGSKPLVIVSQSSNAFAPPGISGAIWAKWRVVWGELQTDFLRLSSDSRRIVAEHAGHHVQAEEPQLVVDSILEVLKSVQTRASRLALH